VSGGTDTHLAVVDVTSLDLTGVEAQRRLDAAGIVVDKAVLPFDTRPVSQGSAVRIGTPSVTLAGLGTQDMPLLADWIVEALHSPVGSGDDGGPHARIRGQITDLPAG
jgi:glycine hydroxymethyltransferase